MSNRVFCTFSRDEIEGYLNGGLPVEILGWNPDDRVPEGVVESILLRILGDPAPLGEWTKNQRNEFKLIFAVDIPRGFRVFVTCYGDDPTPWNWNIADEDTHCSEAAIWSAKCYPTKEAAMKGAEFVLRAILATNEEGQ